MTLLYKVETTLHQSPYTVHLAPCRTSLSLSLAALSLSLLSFPARSHYPLHAHAHTSPLTVHHHTPITSIRRIHVSPRRALHAEVLMVRVALTRRRRVIPTLIIARTPRVPKRRVGRALVVVFRRNVVSRRHWRGERPGHDRPRGRMRRGLAVHVRYGGHGRGEVLSRPIGVAVGVSGMLLGSEFGSRGGLGFFAFARGHAFFRASRGRGTVAKSSGRVGLLVVFHMSMRGRGSLSARSERGRRRGSELVRSDGKTAVFRFRSRDGSSERLTIGPKAIGSVQTRLDQVLAFWLLDERLEFGRGEGVNKPSLRNDQQQDLRACEDGQLVRLGSAMVHLRAPAPHADELTFFMIPAFRLENVICRLDLSPMYSILILRRPLSPSLST